MKTWIRRTAITAVSERITFRVNRRKLKIRIRNERVSYGNKANSSSIVRRFIHTKQFILNDKIQRTIEITKNWIKEKKYENADTDPEQNGIWLSSKTKGQYMRAPLQIIYSWGSKKREAKNMALCERKFEHEHEGNE